ncbi:MAG TPA: cytochrome b N-terminal domain-containing protein [Caulobacterales bacterium]|nr:cytochrome b N-terminal domain-containing protein [Caulobacterales bacterium]
MSGESTYKPGSGFERWLDARLPILRLAHDSFVAYPTPRNLNYWWTFGAILSFCLVVQIITGVILAMHYIPNAGMAFDSVQRIRRDVNFGWLIQPVHAVGASMFFLAAYIHMFRGLYYGSYKAPREVLWILGCVIYLLMIVTAFMGYVLPWGQMSFWGATVITNILGALPLVGEPILHWVRGGFAIENAALNRFFSLHYLLPFIIAGVVVLHIWALHVVGQNNPAGVEPKSKEDTVPFTPHATVKDAVGVALFALMFALFVFYLPDALGDPENYNKANPVVTPPEIVPEWYLLPFYAILRAVPDKLAGVCAMFGAIAVLFVLPWLDTSKVRSMRYRPVARQFFLIFVVVCLGLGWCGAQTPDKLIYQGGNYRIEIRDANHKQIAVADGRSAEVAEKAMQQEVNKLNGAAKFVQRSVPFRIVVTNLAQILAAYYFLFFLVILPLLGLRERPDRTPETIAKSVLGGPPVAATPKAEA